MNRRKDAFLAAARMSPEIYRIAERLGGVCTIGSCTTKPGIVTSVVEECRITLDQRHLDAPALAAMLQEARAASERFAREGNVTVEWERLWRIDPVHFHPQLLELCDQAIAESGAPIYRLPSGPLHDAAEMGRVGIPTIMMFVQSLHGISHNKIEDTKEEHLEMSVTAFDKLAEKALAWVAAPALTAGDPRRSSRGGTATRRRPGSGRSCRPGCRPWPATARGRRGPTGPGKIR